LRPDLERAEIRDLTDRRPSAEAIPAVDQDLGIAREGGWVARHRHDDRNAALGKLARLRLGALAWRIEYHGVEPREFLGDERTAEQVAPHRSDRFEPAGCGGCAT